LLIFKHTSPKARSHGLVVKADGSWPRGGGFKPRHRILYGCKRFASYYIKEKLKLKVAKWGTPKKYFKKTTHPKNSSVIKTIQIN
jgi:hypothetical protein